MDQPLTWLDLCTVEDIPRQGARTVESPRGRIALFRTHDDAVFALRDACPHNGGPLSQGIVHGHAVTCPLHNWVIDLATGGVQGPDEGCAGHLPVRVEQGRVALGLVRFDDQEGAHGE